MTDKKHRVIFNPPRTINKLEINKALSSINREIDQAAEEFYQTKKQLLFVIVLLIIMLFLELLV